MTQALAEYSSNEPSLHEVLDQHFDRQTFDLHTAMPGLVTAYHPDTQSVDVQPVMMRVYKDAPDTPVSLPVIANVPLMQLKSGAAWVKIPIAPGDEVLLVFCERALDVWLANGGQADPLDSRRFALSDAVAIPGISSKPNVLQPKGDVNSVEIQNGGTWIELTQNGKIKVTNNSVDLLQTLSSLIQHLVGLSTTNAVVGSPCVLSPGTITNLNNDLANLQQLMP